MWVFLRKWLNDNLTVSHGCSVNLLWQHATMMWQVICMQSHGISLGWLRRGETSYQWLSKISTNHRRCYDNDNAKLLQFIGRLGTNLLFYVKKQQLRNICELFSSWRLVLWINHLPPACWSTFWKSNFKQQLGCRVDMMDNKSFFWCVLTYAIIYVLIHQIIFQFYLLKYSLFLQVLLY